MRNLTLPFLMMVMGAASAQQTVLDMRPNLRSTPLPKATQQRVLKEVLSLKGLPACTQREGGESATIPAVTLLGQERGKTPI